MVTSNSFTVDVFDGFPLTFNVLLQGLVSTTNYHLRIQCPGSGHLHTLRHHRRSQAHQNDALVEVARWNVSNVPTGRRLLPTARKETQVELDGVVEQRPILGLDGGRGRLRGGHQPSRLGRRRNRNTHEAAKPATGL